MTGEFVIDGLKDRGVREEIIDERSGAWYQGKQSAECLCNVCSLVRRCEEEDGTNPVDKGLELGYLMTEGKGFFDDKPTHAVADEDQACLKPLEIQIPLSLSPRQGTDRYDILTVSPRGIFGESITAASSERAKSWIFRIESRLIPDP